MFQTPRFRAPRVAGYPCGAGALADKPPVAHSLTVTDFDRQNSLGCLLIRKECCPLLVHRRNLGPQALGAVATAVPDVEGEDLACLLVHGEPEPVWIRFLLHEAPQFVCLDLQTPEQPRLRTQRAVRANAPALQQNRQP